MLYELILINAIEQRAKIIFLSVALYFTVLLLMYMLCSYFSNYNS